MTTTQFIRIFFRDSKSYKHINEKEKERMFFIFNRLMARLRPLNANSLNINGIDTALASDVWFDALSKMHTDIPQGLNPNWTKLKKTSEDSVLKNFSQRDKEILALYPELLEEVKEIEKEKKKLEKDGSIKVTKKRGRAAKK